ncbi:Gfo/Idh/MocA family protein [Streptomyces sp. NPDC015414]|uniref:Gfo/Idh/MocA family protein n=1 Tax=Streptomyces sp. NPDC015414 TaxID=3364957 RepID=UPI0036F7DFE4
MTTQDHPTGAPGEAGTALGCVRRTSVRGLPGGRGVTIGSGHFAPIQLAAWREVRGAHICGLVSSDEPDRLRALAEQFDLPCYGGDFEAVAEACGADFVDIVTPPATHGDYIRRAADLGLPILCQKPLAPTVAEAEELVRYAAERGVPLLVNENWRWQPWYREAARLIRAGVIGRPFHSTFRMRPGDGWGPVPYPEQPYFARMERFLLLETGVHYVDTTRFLLGEIGRVTCVTGRVNQAIAGEDLALAVLGLSDGGTVLYDADRCAYADPVRSAVYGTMTIEGEEGNLLLADDGTLRIQRRDGVDTDHGYDIPGGWKGGCAVAAQQHAVEVFQGLVEPETPGDDYLRTMQIIEACYLSAEQRRTVDVGPSPVTVSGGAR